MSCAYCAPKSTTRTVSADVGALMRRGLGRRWCGAERSMPHAHALRLLEGLPLRLQRGSDHDLGLLEVLDVDVAAGGHRGAQTAEEVELAVVLVGGADQDL